MFGEVLNEYSPPERRTGELSINSSGLPAQQRHLMSSFNQAFMFCLV